MTKAEIVAKIAEKTGVEKGSAQAVVESFMEVVMDSIKNKEAVYLRGFGSFKNITREEKIGRERLTEDNPNEKWADGTPKKGFKVVIPEHSVPSFKPAKTFIKYLNNR